MVNSSGNNDIAAYCLGGKTNISKLEVVIQNLLPQNNVAALLLHNMKISGSSLKSIEITKNN